METNRRRHPAAVDLERERLQYIKEMLMGLQTMALADRHGHLAYFIGMAYIDACELARKYPGNPPSEPIPKVA